MSLVRICNSLFCKDVSERKNFFFIFYKHYGSESVAQLLLQNERRGLKVNLNRSLYHWKLFFFSDLSILRGFVCLQNSYAVKKKKKKSVTQWWREVIERNMTNGGTNQAHKELVNTTSKYKRMAESVQSCYTYTHMLLLLCSRPLHYFTTVGILALWLFFHFGIVTVVDFGDEIAL